MPSVARGGPIGPRAAAGAVLAAQWKDGRLLRVHQDGVSKIDGFLEDWGGLASGLVALYQATLDARWLETAVALADGAQQRFWDEAVRAYRTAPRGQADLVVDAYALHDNAVPSGASLLTEAHVALAALTGRSQFLDRAAAYLWRMREPALANPFAYAHLWGAGDALADGAPDVALVGGAAARTPMRGACSTPLSPRRWRVSAFEPGSVPPVLAADRRGEARAGLGDRRLSLPQLHLRGAAGDGSGTHRGTGPLEAGGPRGTVGRPRSPLAGAGLNSSAGQPPRQLNPRRTRSFRGIKHLV